MADSGYLRVEWTNLCYTDWFSNKYTISHDTWYSSVVGVDKKWYFWIDENDLLRIYYIDENWVKRRTDVAESLWNVWSNSKWYIWVWNDSYLYFIWPTWWKMRINGTVTPVVGDDYLCFTAGDTNAAIILTKVGAPEVVQLEISRDKISWADYNWNGSAWDIIVLSNIWDKVYFRNKSNTVIEHFSVDYQNYYQFIVTKQCYASWDISYLLCKTWTSTTNSAKFMHLFEWCSYLVSAPSLPLTQISSFCYDSMFKGCSSLILWPSSLPATPTVGCYEEMFSWCTSLVTPPILTNNYSNAPDYCFAQMFKWCSSLTSTPTLPATTVGYESYLRMFDSCSSLTTVPSLPATTLWIRCYMYMFENSWVNTLPSLPALNLPEECYAGMFRSCGHIDLFTDSSGYAPIPYRIPATWTWTAGYRSLRWMFALTSEITSPDINTTYYTPNTIIS